MGTTKRLDELMDELTEPQRRAVEDFAAFLRSRMQRQEDLGWSDFSLREGLRDSSEGDEEETIYTEEDLIERWQ